MREGFIPVRATVREPRPVESHWLIIERPDGKIEDLGIVSLQLWVPVVVDDATDAEAAFRDVLEWRTADGRRKGHVALDSEVSDRHAEPVATPTRSVWHFGPAAHAKALGTGMLRAQPARSR
jgi:hypothetical protein